jgi:hypothetical protein
MNKNKKEKTNATPPAVANDNQGLKLAVTLNKTPILITSPTITPIPPSDTPFPIWSL